MAKPAVRIKFSKETVGEAVITPEIKFSRGDDGVKSVLRITLGLAAIGDVIDSEIPVSDPNIKQNFRDALLAQNFFRRNKFSVNFVPNGADSTLMTITAELDTKIPGTGAKKRKRASKKTTPKKQR